MTVAAALLMNGVCIAVLGPFVLERATRRLSPVSGIFAWTATMGAVLGSWTAAAVAAGVALRGFDGHLHSIISGCSAMVQSLLGATFGDAMQIGLSGMVGVAALAVVVLLARLVFVLARARSRTHRHCRLVWLVGELRPGAPDALLLDTAERCVYCVAGRPSAIVITRGALEALDPRQLAAVLAHERAHLTERHHLLIAVSRGAAAVLPHVRLFRTGADAIARLVEMRADDVALRDHARPVLAGALLALSGGAQPGAGALCAVSGAGVAERIERLLVPATAERSIRAQLGCATATSLAAPALSLAVLLVGSALCRFLLD